MATTHTLRKSILDTMADLKTGRITTKEARVTAKLAAQAVYTTRLELENKRMEIKLTRSIPACGIASIQSIKL